jgi:hypothetical protein
MVDEGNPVETKERGSEAFVVASETTNASRPIEGTFNNPATGQKDKAAFGLVELDDFQLEDVCGSFLRGRSAGIALINIGQFDVVARHGLNLRGERSDLGAILLAGGSDTAVRISGPACRRRRGLWRLCAVWLCHSQRALRSWASTARCGCPQSPHSAASRIHARWGAHSAHSSSLTSLG